MSLRTGEQYLASFRELREVWLAGEKIQDMPSHPQLGPFAHTLARLYDLQHTPAHQDLLTVESPTSGTRVSRAYQLPRSTDDLVLQRGMFELLQRRCGGVLGRFPQYMASVLLGLYSVRHRFDQMCPEYAGNAERFVAHCRENDLCLTFGFTDPPRDRTLPASAMEYLKVVKRDQDGIVIRGAKAVATLAPYADEYLGLTAPRPDLAPENVIYFAVPTGTDGLKIVCRESFTRPSREDHPLSAAYDEMDAWIIFDDVFVPRERIFMIERLDQNDAVFRQIPSTWGYYYGLVRAAIKAEAVVGLCFAISEALGTRKAPPTEALLAEVVAHLASLRTFITAAEKNLVFNAEGLAIPNPTQVLLGRIHSLEQHSRLLDVLRAVCGSSILMAPGQAELEETEIGTLVRRFIGGANPHAFERFKLMKLAWDYTSDSFGTRQMLFEMYNAGTLATNRARLLSTYDATPHIELARQLAGVDQVPRPA